MTRWLETDSLSNQDISTGLAIGAYTADADRLILVQFFADQVAGNGDYVFYVTLRVNGAGSSYQLVPTTTAAVASGVTAIGGQSAMIAVRSGDVVTVYLDGLAGDNSTPDTVVRWFELAALRPTTADRTLDVSSGGEAGVDWDNVGSPTTTVNLSGTTVKTATDVSGNVYGKVLGGGSGTITGTGVQATISGTLTTLDALWAKIQKWLRLGYRKDAFVATDHATELAEINANTGSGVGTYTSMTDSVEAQRDNVGTAGAGLTALGDTRLAHLDEDVSSVGGGGAGTGTYSDTVTDGADPIDNVLVQLSTDAAGTNMAYRTYSAADGTFTLRPDPGTYYVWLELAGYSFTQGAQVVVT